MARSLAAKTQLRGRWTQLNLEKGDIVRKLSGARTYKIEEIGAGCWLSVRNLGTSRADSWDSWQDVYIVAWNDEDHCTQHTETFSWCDACIDAQRNCKKKALMCDHGHELRDRNICTACEPCNRHTHHSMTCSECAIKASKSAPPSPPTTTMKGNMFSTQVQKVLGGDAGQVVSNLNGETVVLWQSEPQVGKKKDADDVTTTSHERAKNLAEEKLAQVLTGLFT